MPKSLRITALQALADGNTRDIKSVVSIIANNLELTEQDTSQRYTEGEKSVILHYRTTRALRFLALAGFLKNPEQGKYRITRAGYKKLANATCASFDSTIENFYTTVAANVEQIASFWRN